MKSCSTCGLWKSNAEFYPDRREPKRSRDGLHHACKDCERAASNARSRARSAGMARNRDQIMRGSNVCPVSRTQRGKKGAAASAWSKGPTCNTTRAAREFAARRPATRIAP